MATGKARRLNERPIPRLYILHHPGPRRPPLEKENLLVEFHIRIAWRSILAPHPGMRRARWRGPDKVKIGKVLCQVRVRVTHHHRIQGKSPLIFRRDILLGFHRRHIPLPECPVSANSGI
jgi:hypothetical protein